MNEVKNSLNNGLVVDEIADAAGLAGKLRGGATPLCAFLLTRLSESVREALARNGESQGDSEKLAAMLSEELSRLIQAGLLYEKARFENVALRPLTRELLRRNPRGLDLVWLNRLLLRDAFQNELRSKAPFLVAEWTAEGINFTVYCEQR